MKKTWLCGQFRAEANTDSRKELSRMRLRVKRKCSVGHPVTPGYHRVNLCYLKDRYCHLFAIYNI